METALANAIVENTRHFKGLYVPPFLKKGAFILFASDNTDFAEDTADGRGTTHGTVTAVYQKADVHGELIAPPLIMGDAHSLSVTPYNVDVLHCDKPKPQPTQKTADFTINEVGVSGSYQLTQLGWVVASVLSRMKDGGHSSKIPGWAGYNSLLSTSQSVTKVGALPLQPETSHRHYEFMLTPRALFAANGAMLPCTDKAKLIHLLEKLGIAEPPDKDQQQLHDASVLQRDAVHASRNHGLHTH